MKIEKVTEAMLADPPNVMGLLERNRIKRMTDYSGVGRARTFTIDGVGLLTFGEMIKRWKDVAVTGDVSYVRLSLSSRLSHVNCPACNVRLKMGAPFWSHYNGSHARRPFWLNPDDWKAFVGGEYVPPPEQQ